MAQTLKSMENEAKVRQGGRKAFSRMQIIAPALLGAALAFSPAAEADKHGEMRQEASEQTISQKPESKAEAGMSADKELILTTIAGVFGLGGMAYAFERLLGRKKKEDRPEGREPEGLAWSDDNYGL